MQHCRLTKFPPRATKNITVRLTKFPAGLRPNLSPRPHPPVHVTPAGAGRPMVETRRSARRSGSGSLPADGAPSEPASSSPATSLPPRCVPDASPPQLADHTRFASDLSGCACAPLQSISLRQSQWKPRRPVSCLESGVLAMASVEPTCGLCLLTVSFQIIFTQRAKH